MHADGEEFILPVYALRRMRGEEMTLAGSILAPSFTFMMPYFDLWDKTEPWIWLISSYFFLIHGIIMMWRNRESRAKVEEARILEEFGEAVERERAKKEKEKELKH